MVSVVIISYNQKNFIAKTIESVLSQKTNFEYEIIMTDDHSSDGTIEIIKIFQAKSKHNISLIESKTNVGPYRNGLQGYKCAKGKYVIWIDGDDYWDFETKLQIQTDFLEAHNDYVGCFHDARIIHKVDTSGRSSNQSQGEFKLYSQFNEYRSEFSPWHLLKRNLIPTASLLFRNGINLENIFASKNDELSLNWALQLSIIKNNKFKYFNEPWSVYNDHPNGISKTRSLLDFKKANINILQNLLLDVFYKGLARDIYECMANEYLQILLAPEIKNCNSIFIKDTKTNYLQACRNTVNLINST